MNRLLILALMVSLPVCCETLSSDEATSSLSLGVTDHLIYSNAKDPLEKDTQASGIFLNEFQVKAEKGNTTASVQISNRYSPQLENDKTRYFALEKKALAWDGEAWALRAGDTHQELGHGIALSLYQDPVFGLDNTLEGASAQYRKESLEVSGFAGRINPLKSPVAINPTDPKMAGREVYLAGISVAGKVSEDAKLGGHYLLTGIEPHGRHIEEFDYTLGLNLVQENLLEGVDFYAETNWLLAEKQNEDGAFIGQPMGHGGFLSLTYSPLPWKTKLEFKDYRAFRYDFQRPPTLEEDIVLSTNNTDVTATRIGVERRLGESASTLFSTYLIGQDRQYGAVINHPLIGTKLKFDNKTEIELKGGYRWTVANNRLSHASVKTKFRTGKGEALELGVRRQDGETAISTPIPVKDTRNAFDVTYTFSELFNLSLGYEYVPTNATELGAHFWNVGGTYRSGGAFTSRAFIGQTSGGTQCSGGICRQVPAYTGAYLETSVVF